MLSSVEKLQKFVKLEVERGYDNRAVVGGLDKILPSWESEARANHLEEDIIQTVIAGLKEYPSLEPAQRAEALAHLISQLEQSARALNPAPASMIRMRHEQPPRPDTLRGGTLRSETSRSETSHVDTARSELSRSEMPHAEAPQADDETPSQPPAETEEPQTGDLQVRSQAQAQTQTPEPRSPRSSAPARRNQARVYPEPESSTGLNAPLRVLQGVGNKLSQTLATLGLQTLGDLLYYFPRRYDDYSQLKPINRLVYGEETTVLGTIQSIVTRPIRGGKLQMTEALVSDGTAPLRVNWFNQPWLASKFTAGTQVVLAGRVTQYLGRAVMTNPDIEPIEQDHLHTNRIVPVYALTAGLNQKNLRRIMYQTITYWAPRVTDYLPERVRSAVKLLDLKTALINVHFPESQDMLDVARWRLAFDEIFLLQLGVLRQKRSWQALSAEVFETPQEWLDEQTARLPFQLTGAQKRVLNEIRTDLTSGRPMERLVQGDVGSGKTAVAALAVAMVTRAGGQAAVMAPTGILAEQHYRSFTRLLARPVDPTPAAPPVQAAPPPESGLPKMMALASIDLPSEESYNENFSNEDYSAQDTFTEDDYEDDFSEDELDNDEFDLTTETKITLPVFNNPEPVVALPKAEEQPETIEPPATTDLPVTEEPQVAVEPEQPAEPEGIEPEEWPGMPLKPSEIRLLVGDTPESERQVIHAGLQDGSVKLLIGTHALIESPVQFKHLQMAVIDEQHRFGVSQRAALRSKGSNPHLLVMTATPIPRSLALTVYGDLDLSVMDEMPPGRQPVGTFVLRPVERERAYTLIRSQIEQGHQAFIVYPLVEQTDNTQDEQLNPAQRDLPQLSAVEEQQRLQKKIFPKLKVGLLHGRMKPEEKDRVMKAFREREYHILVSTTVIEVGVDIPNATVMLIEGANRFGLAQLHQLRGRVGRGGEKSFCLLIPDSEDAVENERLAVMSETNDGFVLAERDLQQRGPGEFLGTRQAGFNDLKMANLTDVRLIEKARQQAQTIFQNDPELTAPEYQPLVQKLQQFWEVGRGDIS